MAKLQLIGLDADDTLWHHERHYQATQTFFADVLRDHADAEHIEQRLLAAEKKNLSTYGFGIKGFTLSMIETAIEITDGKVSAATLKSILDVGRDMLFHPMELLPGVEDTLKSLHPDYHLVLITKGDLFDQENKLARSYLGDFFHGVEVVSDKTAEAYTKIFRRHGASPEHAMMVGNSLKSDILPALAAGAYAVHVPHELSWVLDRADVPKDDQRFFTIPTMAALPYLIGHI
jgi:putative hydrolase of the HAD superfamily